MRGPHLGGKVTGVDLFFVLSGFLITSIVLENRGSDTFLRGFYARRVLRIWPVYFAVLGGCVAVNALSRQGYGWTWGGLLQNLTFTQNIQGNVGLPPLPFPQPFDPSWSVAIEEQFYLVWPLVALVLGARGMLRVAIGLLVLFSVARLAAGALPNTMLGRGDGLAFGCALASVFALCRTREVSRQRLVRPLLGLGAFALTIVAAYIVRWWEEPIPQWRPAIFPALGALWAATIGLVVLHAGSRFLAPLRWRPLREVGLRSYGLYMMHLPVLQYGPEVARRIGVTHVATQQVLTWLSLALLVAGSFRWMERPILRLKGRFGYGLGRQTPGLESSPSTSLGSGEDRVELATR